MTKTDQEVIRKGVELAYGYVVDKETFTCPYPFIGDYIYSVQPMTQPVFDALAAQLKSQLPEKFDLVEHRDWTHIEDDTIIDNGNGLNIVAEAEGPDRTMNTLRCIVESGVLK